MNEEQLQFAHTEISKTLQSDRFIVEKQERIRASIIELFTTRPSFFEEIQKGKELISLQEKYREQVAWYRKQQSIWENHPQANGNPGWIQLNCYESQKIGTGVNIKIYRTIPVEQYSFIGKLGGLMLALEKLGNTSQDSISFKFPRGLIGFLKHPDSLVIHFQKKENIDSINGILALWMRNHSITQENRNLERTEIAADHSGMSFSELIAVNFAYQILHHPDLYRELLQEAIKISQQPNFS